MRRRILYSLAGLILAAGFLLALTAVSIRSGLQRYSDDALSRFPGDRTEALIQLAACSRCSLNDRNHAVWALGQMAEPRALSVLRKHYDGEPCSHETRLCQYELHKAIRMIETGETRTIAITRLVFNWHRPWRD